MQHLARSSGENQVSHQECDVNPVEEERDLDYKKKRKRGFSEPANLIRKSKKRSL
jgi:hypothetical protein